jgi:hypothetical protein
LPFRGAIEPIFRNQNHNLGFSNERENNLNAAHAFAKTSPILAGPDDDSSTQSSNARSVGAPIDHGVRSIDPVIEPFETTEAWVKHRDTFVRELHPVGALETAYAERAASYHWRLNRVIRYEITATQFDLEGVMTEFIVALDHPEIPRDRSEGVTIEKIRKPLSDYLDDFVKSGAPAAKFPEHQEGLGRVRNEVTRVRERRVLPDRQTIQTIVKYEAHLDRCLARTMAELRRLQKERRQGLREIHQDLIDHHLTDTTESLADPEPCPSKQGDESIAEREVQGSRHVEDERETPSPDDSIRSEDSDVVANRGSIAAAEIAPAERVDRVAKTVDRRNFNGYRVSEATPHGIVTQQPNASGALITMFPPAHYSAIPEVVVRHGPIALETHLHKKE